MSTSANGSFLRFWRDIVVSFLKLGAMSYGGPAIMGIMQAELQEKRQWLSKERFVEGLSLVSMLPGAGATQLGMFLGYARGGWWGALVAGICFALPAFFIMLTLTLAYAALGATPALRGAFYGLGPIVLAIFAVAVYRLGRSAVAERRQVAIALAAMVAAAASPLGTASILLLAGAAGLFWFYARWLGVVVALAVWVVIALGHYLAVGAPPAGLLGEPAGDLVHVALFFLQAGAFTFGGGLTMIAFIQDQVVNQFQWLTPQEFIDGLALGQLTPGPILMVAAYVGFKVAGIAGATVAAGTIFLPSFVLMLSVLPIFARVRALRWSKAMMRGIAPAVIGVLAVSLLQLAPHAVSDATTSVLFVVAAAALLAWRTNVLQLMLAGAGIGVVVERVGRWHARARL